MRLACRTASESRTGERTDSARDFDQGSRQAAADLMQEAGVQSAFLGYRSGTRFPGKHLHFAERRDRPRHRQPAPDSIRRHREARHRRDPGWLGGGHRHDGSGRDDRRAGGEIARGDRKRACNARSVMRSRGERLGDVCAAIEDEARTQPGFSVVREFVGHGVGRKLHEEPQVPNYGKRGSGPRLKAGMTLAIEPMVNLGGPACGCWRTAGRFAPRTGCLRRISNTRF